MPLKTVKKQQTLGKSSSAEWHHKPCVSIQRSGVSFSAKFAQAFKYSEGDSIVLLFDEDKPHYLGFCKPKKSHSKQEQFRLFYRVKHATALTIRSSQLEEWLGDCYGIYEAKKDPKRKGVVYIELQQNGSGK